MRNTPNKQLHQEETVVDTDNLGITQSSGLDRHAVFSRQRTDCLRENNVVSTESARQHKDATDLVMQPYQETVGTLVRSDHKGISNQYVSDDKCIVDNINLIRRLTPLECERLQGFPDGWTNIPGASDSAAYKALGNSVAIPCVDYVMKGIAAVLREEKRRRQEWVTFIYVLIFPKKHLNFSTVLCMISLSVHCSILLRKQAIILLHNMEYKRDTAHMLCKKMSARLSRFFC